MIPLLLPMLLGMASLDVPVTDNFLTALAYVESGWNPRVVGDDGMAVGMYQLWSIYVKEANRILRAYVFSDDQRTDPETSKEITRVVLTYWGVYHKKNGYNIGPAELCSIHRRPNSKWTPKNMEWPLERERTRKFLKLYNALEQQTSDK